MPPVPAPVHRPQESHFEENVWNRPPNGQSSTYGYKPSSIHSTERNWRRVERGKVASNNKPAVRESSDDGWCVVYTSLTSVKGTMTMRAYKRTYNKKKHATLLLLMCTTTVTTVWFDRNRPPLHTVAPIKWDDNEWCTASHSQKNNTAETYRCSL